MLCEKCKNLKEPTLQGIKTKCFAMGFKGKPVAHQADGGWLPGPTPKDLQDWCTKNCKPVEEKIKRETKSKEEKKD